MKKILFFDTETTGFDKPEVVQIAWRSREGEKEEPTVVSLHEPTKPIEFGAMAVHHITNKHVQGKPRFTEGAIHYEALRVAIEQDYIFVAHNAKFDISVLDLAGLKPKATICTMRVAKHLLQRREGISFALQYLRYYLALDEEGAEVAPHDAESDVLVLVWLFNYLVEFARVEWNMDYDTVIDRFITITNGPLLLYTFSMPKYKGVPVERIAAEDPSYLDWILDKSTITDEDVLYTAAYYRRRPTPVRK